MGWKSVMWAGCLLPVLAGCNSVHSLTTEARLAHAQHGIEHKLRKEARVAWQCVRGQHPRRAFTDEFHDGFLDGYVDYLDRGGAAQPPAVPPVKYASNKKYFTPEGHCLIRDYYLGFKYGTDVAVASGRREFLTVPVLLPDAPASAIEVPAAPAPAGPMAQPNPLPPPRPVPGDKFGPPRKSDDPLPPETRPPISTPTVPDTPDNPGRPRLPKPELPVIPPYNPDVSGGKFAPLPVPNDPDLLPMPNPPLPSVPVTPIPVPTDGPALTIPPLPGPGPVPIPVMKVPLPATGGTLLPAPPASVPTLPANVPTPSVLDDIPVIPFKLTIPAPVPVGNLPLGK